MPDLDQTERDVAEKKAQAGSEQRLLPEGIGAEPAGREQISARIDQMMALREKINAVNSTVPDASHQVFVYRYVNEALAELKKQGVVPQSVEVLPTMYSSPADRSGADLMLVDRAKGDVHFLDPSSNKGKTDGGESNVFELRRDGLIAFKRAWFDEAGLLKVDSPKVAEEVAEFQNGLRHQLIELTKAGSRLNFFEGFPVPDVVVRDSAETQRQIKRQIDWASSRADEAARSSRVAKDFADMATKLGRALRFSEQTDKTSESAEFRQVALKEARSSILDFFIFGSRGMEPEIDERSRAKVKVHDGNLLFQRANGQILSAGAVDPLLAESRKTLATRDGILSNLSDQQLERIGVKGESLPALGQSSRLAALVDRYEKSVGFRKNVDRLASTMQSERVLIERGGKLGSDRAFITDGLRFSLSMQSEDYLSGKGERVDLVKKEVKTLTSGPDAELARAIPESVLKELASKTGGAQRRGLDAGVVSAIETLIAEKEAQKAAPSEIQILQQLRLIYSGENGTKAFREGVNERITELARAMGLSLGSVESRPVRTQELPAVAIAEQGGRELSDTLQGRNSAEKERMAEIRQERDRLKRQLKVELRSEMRADLQKQIDAAERFLNDASFRAKAMQEMARTRKAGGTLPSVIGAGAMIIFGAEILRKGQIEPEQPTHSRLY